MGKIFGIFTTFISALSRIVGSLSLSWAVVFTAPILTLAPGTVPPAYALQCAAFFPSFTVFTTVQSTVYTFNQGRVITFTFTLLPGQSLAIIFLGVQQTQTNSGGVAASYTISFTVPNTGPTASGSFTFAADLNGSTTGIDVSGSCDTSTPVTPPPSSSGEEAAANTDQLLDAILNPTQPVRGPRLLEFDPEPVSVPGRPGIPITPEPLSPEILAELECDDLLDAVKSAAAQLQSAQTIVDVAVAKRLLNEANEALAAANCPGEFPATIVQFPRPVEAPPQPGDVDLENVLLNGISCDDKYDARDIAQQAVGDAQKALRTATGGNVDAAIAARDKAESTLRNAESELSVCLALESLANKGVLDAIKGMNKEELEAAIAALNVQLQIDNDNLETRKDIVKREVEDNGPSSGVQGLDDKVDEAKDAVLETELNIRLHQTALDTRSTTSNYAPDTPKSDTSRFDAVINNSRFSTVNIAPILDGNGFSGQFQFGDRDAERPWVIFLNTSGTFANDNRVGADRSTEAWNIALGVQMRINPDVIAGITASYKRATAKSNATDTTLTGDYFSAALSLDRRLGGNAVLALGASYTFGLNDINIAGATGSFEVSMLSANASLSNSQNWNGLTLATSINASINEITRDAYTSSAALFVPGSTTSSANFSASAGLSKIFEDIGSFKTVTPSIGISANFNQREKFAATLTNGVTASQLGLGATLNAGLKVTFQNGVSANLSSSYGLFQDDVQSLSLTGALVFPLN